MGGKVGKSPEIPVLMRSEGQRRLLCLPENGAQIARACKVAQPTVTHWKQGVKTPSPSMRARIEAAFAIPKRTWSEKPYEDDQPPNTAREKRAKTPAANRVASAAAPCGASESSSDPLHGLADQAISVSERLKVISLQHKIAMDRAMLEDRIVREHPSWRAMRAAIVRALLPYPAAAQAVADALRDFDAAKAEGGS